MTPTSAAPDTKAAVTSATEAKPAALHSAKPTETWPDATGLFFLTG